LPRPQQELHETRDGDERICIIIIVIVVDDDHEIVIAATLVLHYLVVVVHGDSYVANTDI
jgi:hypothetical protein